MSNPQTSEEWKKVAENQAAAATNLRSQENQVRKEQQAVNKELDDVSAQVTKDRALIQFAERRIARGDTISPETQLRLDQAKARFAVDSVREQQLTTQLNQIQSSAAPIATQRINAELAAREATQKSQEAAKGPPSGNSVPEPAGDNKNASSATGSPTAVQLDPPTITLAQAQNTPNIPGLPSGFTLSPEGIPSLTVVLNPIDEQPGTEFTPIQSQIQAETQQQTQDAAFINAEAQRQAETDLGATQAEADAIKAEEQRQVEADLGATQAESDAINAEAQKQAEVQQQTEDAAFINAEAQKQAEVQQQTEDAAFINAEAQKQVETELGATQAESDAINAEIQAQQNREAQSQLTREGRRGISGAVNNTREQAIIQDTINFNQIPDWRVRLSLAPSATYLYKATDPGILKPLQSTNGVLFPYTPSIGMSYNANYSPEELIHSNYKIYQYRNSAVEQISITADFTAQDAKEAAYVLAVIHFFRSVTKMFYGKDQNPKAGVPPPLCFIYGMGDFQFNQHPLLIAGFSYNLPNDVDYIRAGAPTLTGGQTSSGFSTPNNSQNSATSRMQSSNVPIGGKPNPPNWTTQTNIEPTYIPTKLQISITALPVVTRKDISDNFSLKDYSTGSLMRGRQNARGGIW